MVRSDRGSFRWIQEIRPLRDCLGRHVICPVRSVAGGIDQNAAYRYVGLSTKEILEEGAIQFRRKDHQPSASHHSGTLAWGHDKPVRHGTPPFGTDEPATSVAKLFQFGKLGQIPTGSCQLVEMEPRFASLAQARHPIRRIGEKVIVHLDDDDRFRQPSKRFRS